VGRDDVAHVPTVLAGLPQACELARDVLAQANAHLAPDLLQVHVAGDAVEPVLGLRLGVPLGVRERLDGAGQRLLHEVGYEGTMPVSGAGEVVAQAVLMLADEPREGLWVTSLASAVAFAIAARKSSTFGSADRM